jgi:hypothetical protein
MDDSTMQMVFVITWTVHERPSGIRQVHSDNFHCHEERACWHLECNVQRILYFDESKVYANTVNTLEGGERRIRDHRMSPSFILLTLLEFIMLHA